MSGPWVFVSYCAFIWICFVSLICHLILLRGTLRRAEVGKALMEVFLISFILMLIVLSIVYPPHLLASWS
jgi:hypothetical protein